MADLDILFPVFGEETEMNRIAVVLLCSALLMNVFSALQTSGVCHALSLRWAEVRPERWEVDLLRNVEITFG